METLQCLSWEVSDSQTLDHCCVSVWSTWVTFTWELTEDLVSHLQNRNPAQRASKQPFSPFSARLRLGSVTCYQNPGEIPLQGDLRDHMTLKRQARFSLSTLRSRKKEKKKKSRKRCIWPCRLRLSPWIILVFLVQYITLRWSEAQHQLIGWWHTSVTSKLPSHV